MSSDPFKLVTDRRFQELRQEAHRHRLVQEARTGPDLRRRGPLSTLVQMARALAQRETRRMASFVEVHGASGVNATKVANAEADVEAHGLVVAQAVRSRQGS